MRTILTWNTVIGLIGGLAMASNAAVATGAVFGSHMVLQREALIPVFGTASNGEAVSVTLGAQTKNTTAANGSWKIYLDAMPAGGPHTLTIKGTNTVTYTDVMVGEVWHCAGQSNMDTRMNYSEYDFATDIAKADAPLLRYITMRQPNQTIKWQTVSPTTAASMTATGYYFGRNLLDNLKGVAVGIVNTSVGGTVIKTWLDPATVAATSDLAGDADAGSMYTSWIKPVEGFGVRGSVYLQGENDASSSALYSAYNRRLEALIKGWRKSWNAPQMPFIVVGLCHKGALQTAVGEASNQASVREAQRQVTDTMPNSILSVAVDLGSATTWHYPQKPELGKRLGALARGVFYGQTGFVYQSPKPLGCYFRGSTIVIPWDVRGSKLKLSSGTAPTGFAISGGDGKWAWASTATLKGDTVFLTTGISKPTQVEFAWANQPIMNLTNSDGLPATPFRMAITPTSGIGAPAAQAGGSWKIAAHGRRAEIPPMDGIWQIQVLDASGRECRRIPAQDLSAGADLDLPLRRGVYTVSIRSKRGLALSEKVVVP
jgi:sialate O-acetylesterase